MDIRTALRAMSAELTPLETTVPGVDEPAYYRPLTLAQSDKIARLIRAEKAESDGAKLAITLIATVMTGEGEPLFAMSDIDWLVNQVPQQILVDMANEVSGISGSEAPAEEAEGN